MPNDLFYTFQIVGFVERNAEKLQRLNAPGSIILYFVLDHAQIKLVQHLNGALAMQII